MAAPGAAARVTHADWLQVNGMDLICEVVQGDTLHGVPIIGALPALHSATLSEPGSSHQVLGAVMSSESRDEVVSKAFKAGAKDFLVKPIRRRELSRLWHHIPQPIDRSVSVPPARPSEAGEPAYRSSILALARCHQRKCLLLLSKPKQGCLSSMCHCRCRGREAGTAGATAQVPGHCVSQG